MSWIGFLGFAVVAVLASLCMTSVASLRPRVASVSNLLFVFHGLFAHIYIFFLHMVLLRDQHHETRSDSVPLGHATRVFPAWPEAFKQLSPRSAPGSMTDTVHNAPPIALVRLVLDEVFSDSRFFTRRTMSPAQIANFVLTEVKQGERDVNRLKASTFDKLSGSLPT